MMTLRLRGPGRKRGADEVETGSPIFLAERVILGPLLGESILAGHHPAQLHTGHYFDDIQAAAGG
jgi:hypothetical protein